MDELDTGRVTDARIEAHIFALLAVREPGASICPSEVARALTTPTRWRALMPRIRDVAGQLAAVQRLRVTRKGLEVDAHSSGGPIRLALPTPRGAAPSRRGSHA